jgi:hypothetical protein
LVNDQNILLPDLLEVDKNSRDDSMAANRSISFYHLSALREGCDTKFVDGKRLARMAIGRLALVPESVQAGDIVAVLHEHARAALCILHYLFHPIQPDGDYSSMDDRIY